MDDTGIIELYFARNEKALTETAEKYGKLCHSLAFNILNSYEDSEECVNDTYKVCWENIPPQFPKNLKYYLCKITRNLSLKKYEYLTRDKRSRNMTVSFEELEEILPDSLIADNIDNNEIGRLINEFLKTQDKETQNIFVRKYYFFDSVKDISKRYSFSQSKVKNILYRTRNKLKSYLESEGVYI